MSQTGLDDKQLLPLRMIAVAADIQGACGTDIGVGE